MRYWPSDQRKITLLCTCCPSISRPAPHGRFLCAWNNVLGTTAQGWSRAIGAGADSKRDVPVISPHSQANFSFQLGTGSTQPPSFPERTIVLDQGPGQSPTLWPGASKASRGEVGLTCSAHFLSSWSFKLEKTIVASKKFRPWATQARN